MTLDEAMARLRELNEPVPKPGRLPTEAEVRAAEGKLHAKLPADLKRFLLEASDVVFSTLEPVTVTDPTWNTDLVHVAQAAWQKMGLPRNLVPICEDNGDYYAMSPSGEVRFWSHNDGKVTETWKDLATWIEEVWIGEAGDE
jgi:hypothetical protein